MVFLFTSFDFSRKFSEEIRQTAKIKLLPSLFGCLYSRVKLFVFAMNSRRSYSTFVCFIYGLEEKNSKTKVIFAVCRLPLTSCLTSLFEREKMRWICQENAIKIKVYVVDQYLFSLVDEKK